MRCLYEPDIRKKSVPSYELGICDVVHRVQVSNFSMHCESQVGQLLTVFVLGKTEKKQDPGVSKQGQHMQLAMLLKIKVSVEFKRQNNAMGTRITVCIVSG